MKNVVFNGPTAGHETRMQLSGILCDRELTHEEAILHNVATRYMIRILTACDESFNRDAEEQQKKNEDPPRLPGPGPKEIPPGEEPGLLSPN